eukprot:1158546-Pelagomonas_calceolata.AAC.8
MDGDTRTYPFLLKTQELVVEATSHTFGKTTDRGSCQALLLQPAPYAQRYEKLLRCFTAVKKGEVQHCHHLTSNARDELKRVAHLGHFVGGLKYGLKEATAWSGGPIPESAFHHRCLPPWLPHAYSSPSKAACQSAAAGGRLVTGKAVRGVGTPFLAQDLSTRGNQWYRNAALSRCKAGHQGGKKRDRTPVVQECSLFLDAKRGIRGGETRTKKQWYRNAAFALMQNGASEGGKQAKTSGHQGEAPGTEQVVFAPSGPVLAGLVYELLAQKSKATG